MAAQRGISCHVFHSDLKVRIDEVFYYPDLMVTCGVLDLAADFQTQPTLIVEIIRLRCDGWVLQIFGPGDIVRFEAIDFEVPLAELYAEVVQPG